MDNDKACNGEEEPARILVLGGAYGGMAAATNLADLCAGKSTRFGLPNPQPGHKVRVEITIVDERDGYYHLIGSPLAFADEQYAEKVWIKFDDIPALQSPQFRVLQGSVTNVDLARKAAWITTYRSSETVSLEYDYLVAATGLRRAWPSVPQALNKSEYLDEVGAHIEKVAHAKHGVAVIGGGEQAKRHCARSIADDIGAVGIEMAAELKLVCPHIKVSLVHSRDRLLSSEPLPDDFKDQTLDILREAGVEVILGKRVQDKTDSASGTRTLHLSDGSTLSVSEAMSAISGPEPTTSCLPASALNSAAEVIVNSDLTFASSMPGASSYYAIGDLIPQRGVKRCGGAMHHGHYAAYNIHQQILLSRGVIEKPAYQELIEHDPNIGLAVGKKAIGYSEQTGIMKGEETLQYLFGNDLGFRYCWDYLKLSERFGDEDVVADQMSPEPENAVEVLEEKRLQVTAEA